MFDINSFSQKLVGGGARPTLFRVDLATPFNPGINTITSFMIESTTLPASNLGRIEVPYMGRKMIVAGDRTFDAWQVNIINDESFQIRHAMEEWHNRINSLAGNLMNTGGGSNPSRYKQNAQVLQYGKSSETEILRQYNFIGLFPVEISAIDLDWNRTDEIERFQVTFAYDYYTISGGPAQLS
jgi:hypothetical protein